MGSLCLLPIRSNKMQIFRRIYFYVLCFSIWTENDQEDDLQIYVAKIPKIYVPSVLMSETESTEMNNKHNRGAGIEVKQKPKASPILRPRAVVSSPGMFLELLFDL